MIPGAVIERYARAIFELGVEGGQTLELARMIQTLADAYETSREFRVALENPLVPEDQRDATIRELATRTGASELAANAVRLLVRRRRLAALPDIARRLSTLNDEKTGIVRAKVTSAVPLSEDFCQKLTQKLEASLKKKVVLERAHDPSLLAGIVTRIGDHTIDGSLKGSLQSLERNLLQA